MKILITGATGFVGRKLVAKLLDAGHEILALTRDPESAKKRFRTTDRIECVLWNPTETLPEPRVWEGVEAVFHLAGESVVSGRWNEKIKREIYNSRVLGTKHLVQGYTKQHESQKLKTFISASAIGIYGDRADEELTEESSLGSDFLAGVCKDWEAEVFSPALSGVRRVAFRLGVVLGVEGGAMPKLLPPFKFGLGGPLGSGRQWMSWIAVEDVVSALVFALEHPELNGPVNLVSPHPVTNKVFTETLGLVLSRPTFLKVPAFVLKAGLGEASQVLLASQRVVPRRLVAAGFQFSKGKLDEVLKNI